MVAFESRRAKEIAILIQKSGGEAIVAPSVREVPVEDNTQAFEFAERLFAGEFDMMVLLTGVGVKALDKVLASRYPVEQFREALRKMGRYATYTAPALLALLATTRQAHAS